MGRKTMATRILLACWLTLGCACLVRAQEAVQITYPQPNQDVRGEIDIKFTGVPQGGYAIIKVDGVFKEATAQDNYTLNTFPPTFPGDGTHKISVTAVNPNGHVASQAEVSFNVANSKVDPTGTAVNLVHWKPVDILEKSVQRYRIFAESNGIASGSKNGGSGAGPGGSSPGGMTGDTGASCENWLEAPLDWQLSALVRRFVRDVNMFDGSANIRSIVQTAFQHQREVCGPPPKKKCKVQPPPRKKPWDCYWFMAPETGQFYVKTIKPNGDEINATRKGATLALADLLPVFPLGEVQPGSTWQTNMTFLTELSERKPINVQTLITFTSVEKLTTPNGEILDAAKLESRFQMPTDVAKKIAVSIQSKSGSSTGGGAFTPGAGASTSPAPSPGPGGAAGAGASGQELSVDDIDEARCRVARVLWFDIANHRVLRSEDFIDTVYKMAQQTSGDSTGAAAGGAAGEGQEVSYNLRVTTWLDDRIPAPSDTYTAGLGTAQAHDSVDNPSLDRILQQAH